MSSYRNRADQRVADDVNAGRHLMCAASGCPLRWSVDFGTPLCSAHAGKDPLQWPAITQRVLDAELAEAVRRDQPKPQAQVRHFTAADKRAVGQKLRQALRANGGRQWAERLREREERGEHLTDAQRAMWRQALGRGLALHDFDEVPA